MNASHHRGPAGHRLKSSVAALAVALFAPLTQAATASISLSPSNTSVSVSDTFTLDVVTTAASNFIGAFDFTVSFGTAGVLALTDVSFSSALGAGASTFSALPNFGGVAVVFNTADIPLQASSPFTLATLSFTALAGGTTTVTLGSPTVGDFDGNAITGADLVLGSASVTVLGGNVSPIPEPATYALMLAGLGVLAWTARRRSSHG